MDICIKTIPNSEHRPGIAGGDWYFDSEGNLQIRVSKMSDERYELALGLHEMVEAILCRAAGITVAMVDKSDMDMIKKYPDNNGLNGGDEPGECYAKQHSFATAAERILTAELGVCWRQYDDELGALKCESGEPNA